MTGPASLTPPACSAAVHVVLSDEGWILERLARELATRLPYVTYGLQPDATAAIQYYVTYGARRARVSPIEVSLFTHREEIPAAAERFDDAAREIDFAIAMSGSTERLLADLGVGRRACISPGVDLDRFRPKLKIAVVGRTYHTGRKGEALVRAVMDLPDIEWHFTGTGWPDAAEHVPEADLPAFYRSMDYILVPALNEGGPMSVLEALACGVPVIGSAVGWVPDFPHIPFERGDAESLRAVLVDLTARHFALRASVDDMTWDRWAEQHDALFRRLLAEGAPAGAIDPAPAASPLRSLRSAALMTHGSEDTTLGGPSVRVPRTAAALRSLNLRAQAIHNFAPALAEADLIHLFNVWQPATAIRAARYAKSLGKPLIVSPILLDLSETTLWRDALPAAFAAAETPEDAERAAAAAVKAYSETRAAGAGAEPEPGYRDTIVELARLADGLVFLSEKERAAFGALTGGVTTPGHLVRNPVDAALFGAGDPDLFRDAYGLDDYVLCVARLEPRKNQLMLAAALRDTGLPLVLVGHSADAAYTALVDRFGGGNLLRVDRLEPGSEMLRSAIAGARVFALPSWAEGAPLAALEAGAAGANMVLSDRSGEREYFGEHARYCDPASIDSIRNSVMGAWLTARTRDRAGQQAHVAATFTWDGHARETLAVYEEVAARHAIEARLEEEPAGARTDGGLILDVTTLANQATAHTGIVRVERSLARELLARADVGARFVMYHSPAVGFIEVPREVIANDFIVGFVAQAKETIAATTIDLDGVTQILTVGSGWMQNLEYGVALARFARSHRLALTVLMHDMTPTMFPHWYPAGYSDAWEKNCAVLLAEADRLLVYSESTLRDVRAFAGNRGLAMPPVGTIRLADTSASVDRTAAADAASADVIAVQAELAGKPYVLAVGGIHVRKNYQLLYDVWLKLVEEMGASCPHLVIVGGVSWNGQDLARAFREDRRVSRHIHVLGGIDDRAVDWLYDNALFTAYPSLYEGWGLPVGESLAHGKICLSSNTSSMVEIAPALTDLLDPVDRVRWTALVRHYAASASSRSRREAAIREGFAPTSWSRTLDDILTGLAGSARDKRVGLYNLGAVAVVAKGRAGEAFLGEGWFRSESWGSWARTLTTRLDMRLPNPATGMLTLDVLAKVFKRPETSRRYDVRANGVSVGAWQFLAKRPGQRVAQDFQLYRARIPAALVGADGRLVIEFATDQHTAVAELSPASSDRRSLGLGIVAFMIEADATAGDPLRVIARHRDVAAILGRAGGKDIETALADEANIPAMQADRWVRKLAPFLRRGQAIAGGARSDRGMLQLAFGLSRLRLDRAGRLEIMVDVSGASPETPVKLALSLNDQWLGVHQVVTSEPHILGFDVSVVQLAQADPAMIALICEANGPVAPEVMVSGVRLAQDAALSSGRPPLADAGDAGLPDGALGRGWYDREAGGVWSIGALGRIAFADAPAEDAPACLMVEVTCMSSGGEDDAVEVRDSEGRPLARARFAPRPAGVLHPAQWLAVPLAGDADADGLRRHAFALAPVNPAWPALFGKAADQRRVGVQLRSASLSRLAPLAPGAVVAVESGDDAWIGWLGDWHPLDPGTRWCAGDPAALAVRAGSGEGDAIELHVRILPSIDGGEALTVHPSVDGCDLPPVELASGDHRLRLPLPPEGGADGVHIVSIAGVPLVSPAALAMSADERLLGIGILAVGAAPFAEAPVIPDAEPALIADVAAMEPDGDAGEDRPPMYLRAATARG